MKLLSFLAMLLMTPGLAFASPFVLPVKFHLMQDVPMEFNGQQMNVWVTEGDIRGQVIKEVNRIWQQADIKWEIEDVVAELSADIPDKAEQLQFVTNTKRDERGKSDKSRLPVLYSLIDKSQHSDTAYNVYIFPFIGQGSQGHASRQDNIVVIGAWTNKPTKGKGSAAKAKLVEAEPFKQGSLARTVAHELGHMLKLEHPDKATQTEFNLLMGGKKAGYLLTPKEIEKAQKVAKKRKQ